MCAYSAVLDYVQWDPNKIVHRESPFYDVSSIPTIWPNPKIEYHIIPQLSSNPFSNWSFDACHAYVELIEKAIKFDQLNNEPNCEDPQKKIKLNDLYSRVAELGLNDKSNPEKYLELMVRIRTFYPEISTTTDTIVYDHTIQRTYIKN